ncbi:protein sneaky isoform X5 [Bactrocera dorsalis]|uniref:Protein sneaky isoform X5 n=2 Tax=Bactrocera dorsalis TaxID=27457 RepID=A0ABM3J418_BACDO|nr:protein sneaky isoform X5 [Bactrocera dorsalis]
MICLLSKVENIIKQILYIHICHIEMFYFIKRKFCLMFSQKCRSLYCILLSRNVENWTCKRYFCSSFVGFLVATVLWFLLLLNFQFSLEMKIMTLGIIVTLVGTGFLFTSSLKCITLLIFMGMAGKSGRSYLRALSFAYIITGPIANLAANGGEVVRVFACATTLTYNLTKTRLDIMIKPFQKTLNSMENDLIDVEKSFEKMNEILLPIRVEVGGADYDSYDNLTLRKAENMGHHVQKTYTKKFETRCKRQIVKGEKRCREAFAKAHTECENKFPRIVRTFLCWPFQVDFICHMNLLGKPDMICKPNEVLPSNFGDNYVQLNDAQNTLFRNTSEVELKYKVKSVITHADMRALDHISDIVVDEFNAKKKTFDVIMHITNTILSLLVFKVAVAAVVYHKKYLSNIDFDNIYVTDYFRQVDDRRKRNKKPTILPLTKFEKNDVVDLERTCYRTENESKIIFFYFLQFSLEILTACFFLILDHVIITLLNIIRFNSFITYTQEGEHIINFQVKGSGLMARLLQRTLKNFNIHEQISTYLTNEYCLPNAHIMPKRFYLKLAATNVIIIVLIYKCYYFMRMRRIICSYFYHKREKQRILYLYNSLLRKRKTVREVMRRTAESNVHKRRIRRRINLLLFLRLKWPNYCSWYKFCAAARLKCLICDGLEDNNFIICKNPKCQMGYCYECWRDLGVLCISCQTYIKTIEILDFNIYFELVNPM